MSAVQLAGVPAAAALSSGRAKWRRSTRREVAALFAFAVALGSPAEAMHPAEGKRKATNEGGFDQ